MIDDQWVLRSDSRVRARELPSDLGSPPGMQFVQVTVANGATFHAFVFVADGGDFERFMEEPMGVGAVVLAKGRAYVRNYTDHVFPWLRAGTHQRVSWATIMSECDQLPAVLWPGE